jgi:hypothetical protein
MLQEKPIIAEMVKQIPYIFFQMNLPLEPTVTLFQQTTTQPIYLTSILILS